MNLLKKKNYTTILFILIPLITVMIFYIFKGKLNEYPDSTFRNTLEIIYFVSSSFLLLVGAIGLKQLRIAKESSKKSAQRESFKLAAEQCTHFLTHILSESNKVDTLLRTNSVKNLGEVAITVDENKISFNTKLNRKDFNRLPKDGLIKIASLLNSIEAFSVFFTQRVADENVAFSSIGYTYCQVVKDLLPIVLLGSEGGKKGYSNIIKLYVAWNQRLETQDALEEKLKAEEKLNQTVTMKFKSLGT